MHEGGIGNTGGLRLIQGPGIAEPIAPCQGKACRCDKETRKPVVPKSRHGPLHVPLGCEKHCHKHLQDEASTQFMSWSSPVPYADVGFIQSVSNDFEYALRCG
jgi:hypothetical protein